MEEDRDRILREMVEVLTNIKTRVRAIRRFRRDVLEIDDGTQIVVYPLSGEGMIFNNRVLDILQGEEFLPIWQDYNPNRRGLFVRFIRIVSNGVSRVAANRPQYWNVEFILNTIGPSPQFGN